MINQHSQTPKTRFFSKKKKKETFKAISSLYADLVSSRKLETLIVLPFPIKRKNLTFQLILQVFCLKHLKPRIFSKYVLFNFQSLCCCNFMQKIITFQELIFDKIWKTSFWPILVQTLGKVFPQKIVCVNFKSLRIHWTLYFGKVIRCFTPRVWVDRLIYRF